MRLKAIVVRPGGEGDLEKRANLFTSDSVHGAFQGTKSRLGEWLLNSKRQCDSSGFTPTHLRK